MPDFCSRSASLRSRSAFATGDRMLAASTTRPVSGGKFAAAKAAPIQSAATKAASRVRHTASIRLELHLGRGLRLGLRSERDQRLRGAKNRRRPKNGRKRPERRVEILRCRYVVPARDCDAVLGAFELRLQSQEILVRFEVRIVLADGEEATKGARQRGLRLLQLLDLLGIGEVVGVEMDRSRLGAGLRHLGQDVLLLFCITLNRGDEIGHEIGPTLVLVLDLGPSRLGRLLLGRNDVVAASRQRNSQRQKQKKRAQPRKKPRHRKYPSLERACRASVHIMSLFFKEL